MAITREEYYRQEKRRAETEKIREGTRHTSYMYRGHLTRARCGSRTKYVLGCRCKECQQAQTDYDHARWLMRKGNK
jgi:hypothetical protein